MLLCLMLQGVAEQGVVSNVCPCHNKCYCGRHLFRYSAALIGLACSSSIKNVKFHRCCYLCGTAGNVVLKLTQTAVR